MQRTFAVNDAIDWRGLSRGQFYLRGRIEIIDYTRDHPYGVRFENGNFYWSKADQMRLSRERTQ